MSDITPVIKPTNKPGRGGKRPGAGRKATGRNTINSGISIKKRDADEIFRITGKKSLTAAITQLLYTHPQYTKKSGT